MAEESWQKKIRDQDEAIWSHCEKRASRYVDYIVSDLRYRFGSLLMDGFNPSFIEDYVRDAMRDAAKTATDVHVQAMLEDQRELTGNMLTAALKGCFKGPDEES